MRNKTPMNNGEFGKIATEKGMKAALEWRDGPFGGIVGRYPPVK